MTSKASIANIMAIIPKTLLLSFMLSSLVISGLAQTKNKYSYLSQKKFIPAELGKVYLGMPFANFAKQINLKDAVVDNRYGWLEAKLPYAKGNVETVIFKVYGLDDEEYAKFIHKVTRPGNMPNGDEYEEEVQMIDPVKIPVGKGIVYEISLHYKKGFDLKSQAAKMFGVSKDVYKK